MTALKKYEKSSKNFNSQHPEIVNSYIFGKKIILIKKIYVNKMPKWKY